MSDRILHLMLDNGHGLNTAGKCSPTWPNGKKLVEAELARDIVKRLFLSKDEFIGVELHNIVPETSDIELPERSNRINKLCNTYGYENCFVISIHANGGGGTGWEVLARSSDMAAKYPKRAAFFSTEKYKSMSSLSYDAAELAGSIAKKELPEFKLRQMYANKLYKEQNVHILREIECAGILTENLFMDTWRDCEFLLSEKGRVAITDLHKKIIIKVKDKFFK